MYYYYNSKSFMKFEEYNHNNIIILVQDRNSPIGFHEKNNYPSVSQIPASIIPLIFHTPNNYPGVFPTSASGGIGFSYFRGNFRPAEAEFRHLRVTVLTSGRRRPPCRAVSCRAALGLQHVQLVPCRVVLGHRNATTVPCPCPCAAPCRARF